MRTIRLALLLALAAGTLFESSALAGDAFAAAPDAGVVDAASPPDAAIPVAAPMPLDDPGQLAARAVTAADRGDWRVLAVALLGLAGFLLRNKTPTEGKVGVFLHSKWGALLVSAVSAGIGTAIPELQGGATVRGVVISAVASAVAAFCGWLTPAPVAAKVGGAVAVLAVLMLGGCAAADDALASLMVLALAAGSLYFAVRVMRAKPNPLLALALLAGLAGCAASPKQVFYTTTIATVQTVDEGIGVFTGWAVAEEDHIANDAIAACKDKPTRTLYLQCAVDLATPRREPIDKVKMAIRVYQGAKRAGEAGASVDLAGAARGVAEALSAVGIKVGG